MTLQNLSIKIYTLNLIQMLSGNTINCHLIHNNLGAVLVVVVWKLTLQPSGQSVPIITKFVSTNPVHGEVYSIQHYVIKFGCGLRQVGGFLLVLWFSPTNTIDRHDITEILLKVELNTISLHSQIQCSSTYKTLFAPNKML